MLVTSDEFLCKLQIKADFICMNKRFELSFNWTHSDSNVTNNSIFTINVVHV